MHRLAALSLCALIPLHHGASHTHADIDLQFEGGYDVIRDSPSFSLRFALHPRSAQ